jgi:hypothetical protein
VLGPSVNLKSQYSFYESEKSQKNRSLVSRNLNASFLGGGGGLFTRSEKRHRFKLQTMSPRGMRRLQS